MQNIRPVDMPNDDLRYIAENAGIDAALALIIYTPGLNVGIPKSADKILKDKFILNNYDGTKYSINELAVQCNVSQRYVYRLINKKLHSKS